MAISAAKSIRASTGAGISGFLLCLPFTLENGDYPAAPRTSMPPAISPSNPIVPMNSLNVVRRAVASFAVVSLLGFLSATGHAAGCLNPAEALDRLKLGNERFVVNRVSDPKPTAVRRAETSRHQSPFAIIVGCADSRVGPETVFDQTIGDLFAVRVAGNLVDDFALGSLEYAVEHLGTRLIVVLGHQRCGAISAAIAAPDAPHHIGNIVRALQPAVQAARGRPGDLPRNATEINAEMVAAKIRKEAHFGAAAPEVVIVAGYYVLDTGRIEWTKPESETAPGSGN